MQPTGGRRGDDSSFRILFFPVKNRDTRTTDLLVGRADVSREGSTSYTLFLLVEVGSTFVSPNIDLAFKLAIIT